MRNWRLIIMICIAVVLSFSAGCAIRTGDDASEASIADDVSSDSSENPFSAPADDTSVEDESSDDATVADADTDADTDTSEDLAAYDDVEFVTKPADESEFKAGEEKTTDLIEVDGGSEEGFTWTHDMPAGFEVVEYNPKASRIQIKGDPTEDVVGEYTVTLTATDVAGEHGSASFSFQLVVTSSVSEVAVPDLSDISCSQDLTIEITKNGDWDLDDMDDNTISPMLGTKGHEIQFKAMRGDKPAKDVSWTWKSEVEESLHCINPIDPTYMLVKGDALAGLIQMGIMQNYYPFHYGYIENSSASGESQYDCVLPVQLTPSLVVIPGVMHPRPTVNETWLAERRSPDDPLTLTGDFVYKGPLPVFKLRHNGQDDLNRQPVEAITVTATDSCIKEGNTIQRPAALKARFNLIYPDDPVSNVKVKLTYKNSNMLWSGAWLAVHLQGALQIFEKDGNAVPEYDWYHKRSAASAQWGVDSWSPDWNEGDPPNDKYLEGPWYWDGCGDNACSLDWKSMIANDDEAQPDNVGSVTNIVLFMEMGGCVTSETLTSSETTCPDLDIRKIEFRSNNWEATYDDQDGGDILNANYGDFWEDYRISNRDNYPGMDKSSVRCDEDSCAKGSVFHRRAFPIYD